MGLEPGFLKCNTPFKPSGAKFVYFIVLSYLIYSYLINLFLSYSIKSIGIMINPKILPDFILLNIYGFKLLISAISVSMGLGFTILSVIDRLNPTRRNKKFIRLIWSNVFFVNFLSLMFILRVTYIIGISLTNGDSTLPYLFNDNVTIQISWLIFLLLPMWIFLHNWMILQRIFIVKEYLFKSLVLGVLLIIIFQFII